MKLTELFLSQLTDEGNRTRGALEQVPEGRDDWKPHDKSMPLGQLAMLVARMPSWVSLVINQPELDIAPTDGSNVDQKPLRTAQELVQALDESVTSGRDALTRTSDEHLMTNWHLLAGGTVVLDQPRYIVLRDTFAHLAHHRGQLTVYLRLTGAKVPSIYGPSADDQRFN
jgi:uncharacterized damage-inducible protein DinB